MKKPTLLAATEAGVCRLRDSIQEVADGILSRAVLTTPAVRVTLFRFSAGQQLSEHTSKSRVLLQVLDGVCEFTAGGIPHLLKAGDLFHLPPNVPHAVGAPEDFSMLLTQVTEPDVSPA